MSTHIGDACRAAGLLPIAMAVKCTKLDRSGRARIVDFCHRLLREFTESGGLYTGACYGYYEQRPCLIEQVGLESIA